MDQLEISALFVITLAESAGVPVPVPYYLLLVYAGVRHRSSFWDGMPVVATCCVATILGAVGLFAVIRRWGRPLVDKYTRYLGRNAARMERMQTWFIRHRRGAIFVGRLTPGLETATTVIAGTIMMPWTQYLFSATAAALISSLLYYSTGSLLGDAGARVIARMPGFLGAAMFLALAMLGIVISVVASLRARRSAATR